MTNLTQFHLFPLLPFELRLKIWAHALTQPRTITISCKKSFLDIERRTTELFICQTPTHPLFHVCHESRHEALNTYSYLPRFKTFASDRCIYINFDYDVLRCAASVLEYMGDEEIRNVKKMIIEVGDAAYFGHFHMETIHRMANVGELQLLANEGETYSWHRGGDQFVESLTRDFQVEMMSNPGWRSPRIRIVHMASGKEMKVIRAGPLIEGWKEGDDYPSDWPSS